MERTSDDLDTGDLGLFGPGSVTWRVHAEPILVVGGLRSLYLQALHPRAIAGVMQNSDYRHDPWGRLIRTVNYVTTVVFGTTDDAERAGAQVRKIHDRLRAVDPDTGEEFRVDEPDLLRWVHVAEVESFLSTARAAGLRLSDADADRYLTEQLHAARLVGLDPDTVPGTVAEVAAYYADMRPQLRLTASSAEAALFVSVPPMPWGLGFTPLRGLHLGVAAMAVGLLPGWARRLYGLPGLAVTGLSANLSARALRLTLNMLPHELYEGPIYQAAMRRAAAAR